MVWRHDAANSIATVVSTRVLSPTVAVFWAAFFNFIAAFFLGTAVAKSLMAWSRVKGTSAEDAMQHYIDLVASLRR